jgi:hypothetical protein
VSDSFALAELQNEPVLAGVGEHAARQSTGNGLDAAVAQSFGGTSQPELRVPAGRARGMDSDQVLRPVALGSDHPAFDEVARRIRDATDMVPV